MHSFDSLARSLAASPRQADRRRKDSPILAPTLSVGFALLPLAVMVQAYLQTA